MKSLSESILNTDQRIQDSINIESQKIIVDKLMKKLRSRVGQQDVYGRDLHIGDVVIIAPNFYPCTIVELEVKNRKTDIVVYDPSQKTERVETIFNVFKLDEPLKLLNK